MGTMTKGAPSLFIWLMIYDKPQLLSKNTNTLYMYTCVCNDLYFEFFLMWLCMFFIVAKRYRFKLVIEKLPKK